VDNAAALNAQLMIHITKHLNINTVQAYKPDVEIYPIGFVLPLYMIASPTQRTEYSIYNCLAFIAQHDYVTMDDYRELTWYVKNAMTRQFDPEFKLRQAQTLMARVFGFQNQADLKEFANKHHPELVRNLRVKRGCCSENGDKPALQKYTQQQRVARQPRSGKGEQDGA
jgi:hypothetical protein